MGCPKLLLPWRTTTVVEHMLQVWRASQVVHVILVVRADDGALADAGRRSGADIVLADPPPPDMKASVLAGLAHAANLYAPNEGDAWLLAPADMPMYTPATIDRVIEEAKGWREHIVVPCYAGQRGHPVLFPWRMAAAAAALAPDVGLNQLLKENAVREVDVFDQGVLADLDTVEDYRKWHDG